MREMINTNHVFVVQQGVEELLANEDSGHGYDHVSRVVDMTAEFSRGRDDVRKNLALVTAWLHDADDYKLVGSQELATQQINAGAIMQRARISQPEQAEIKANIASMGYSKALRGIRPSSPEGEIVSDADMCDAIGAIGVVRCLTYALSSKGSGVVFDSSVWPNVDIGADQYNSQGSTHDGDSFVNHFFEKLLKVPGMMMTGPGRAEAARRDKVMTSFLSAYFHELGEERWSEYLSDYIASRQRHD